MTFYFLVTELCPINRNWLTIKIYKNERHSSYFNSRDDN